MIAVSGITHALTWQKALFGAVEGDIGKTYYKGSRYYRPRLYLYRDASPWGFGEFATWGGEPFAYLKGAWTQDDCNRLELVLGDCRGQAV